MKLSALLEFDAKQHKENLRKFLRFSKVKKLVYHFSRADFDTFDTTKSDLGAHFGTMDQANHRANTFGEGHIMPVYINLENPLRLKDVGSFHADGVAMQLAKKGWITKKEAKQIETEIEGNFRLRAKYDPYIRDLIKSRGYDGVVYKNDHEGAGDSYIVFSPQQIKSATGNRGTFNLDSESMTESKK